MLLSEISEYDVVRLKDGREGTVLEIYKIPGVPVGLEIEITGTEEMETVQLEQVEKVVWKLKQ